MTRDIKNCWTSRDLRIDELQLSKIKGKKELPWTILCPSLYVIQNHEEGGIATGIFRLGLDDVLYDDQGVSSISSRDYATAFIDELENPQHEFRRFTVGY